MKSEILAFPTRAVLARYAATQFVVLVQDAVRTRGKFCVALSGGSTPRDLYALLATQEFSTQLDWTRIHLFWSDERCVPPDHPDSNFKLANDALVAHVPIPGANVHRIRAELAADDVAREYEEALRYFFSLSHVTGEGWGEGVPVFDLILLGLGADAHTASLFPHTPALHETQRWVAAQYIEKLKTHRVTFTPPLINAATNIWFLVAGADKADAVHAVLRGDYRPEEFPAQLIQPMHGKTVWLLDEGANQKLQAKKSKV